MKLHATAILAAATLSGSSALAADYFLVSSNPTQVTLIDRDQVTKARDGLLTAPLIAIRRAPGAGFAYAVVVTRFDCAGQKAEPRSLTVYDHDGSKSAKQPTPSAPFEMNTVQPHSQAADAMAFVCAPRAERRRHGVHISALTLPEIIASLTAGTWPYDTQLAELQGGQPAVVIKPHHRRRRR